MLKKTICCLAVMRRRQQPLTLNWPFFGGDQAGLEVLTLTQINRDNVRNLKVAWEWRTGEKALEQYKTTPGVLK